MQIKSINAFRFELKRLAKKYPSLLNDILELTNKLSSEPFQGTPIGKDYYKIRLKIASKNTGKSGGARVVTHVFVAGDTVTLLSIYDKSEQEDIPETEILKRLKGLS